MHLEKFSGNRDDTAQVIAKDQFLPLLEWLQTCEFTLLTSRLPAELHVPVLTSHLTGAAKRSFMRKWGSSRAAEVATWSLNTAKVEIAALVPNHKVLFTKTALAMQFSARSLENDLQRFALYLRNGEMPVDGSEYVFDVLQEKMQQAVPDVFTLSTSLYNRQLVFKGTFAEIMQDAIEIVSTLQVHGKLSGSARERSVDDAPPTRKRDKRLQVKKAGDRSNRRRPGDDAARKQEFFALAKRFSRCYGCGQHIAAKDLAAHKATCSRNPADFARRMGQVKKLVDTGKAAEVNEFPTRPKDAKDAKDPKEGPPKGGTK